MRMRVRVRMRMLLMMMRRRLGLGLGLRSRGGTNRIHLAHAAHRDLDVPSHGVAEPGVVSPTRPLRQGRVVRRAGRHGGRVSRGRTGHAKVDRKSVIVRPLRDRVPFRLRLKHPGPSESAREHGLRMLRVLGMWRWRVLHLHRRSTQHRRRRQTTAHTYASVWRRQSVERPLQFGLCQLSSSTVNSPTLASNFATASRGSSPVAAPPPPPSSDGSLS